MPVKCTQVRAYVCVGEKKFKFIAFVVEEALVCLAYVLDENCMHTLKSVTAVMFYNLQPQQSNI